MPGFGIPGEGLYPRIAGEPENSEVRSQKSSDVARAAQALAPRVAPANIVFFD